jgi:hypothetical protein
MRVIPFIIMALLLSCKERKTDYHDGTYFYTDLNARIPNKQRIDIKGAKMLHFYQAINDSTNVKSYKDHCTQYPDRIELLMWRGHSVLIKVDSIGNLIYDNRLFTKE